VSFRFDCQFTPPLGNFHYCHHVVQVINLIVHGSKYWNMPCLHNNKEKCSRSWDIFLKVENRAKLYSFDRHRDKQNISCYIMSPQSWVRCDHLPLISAFSPPLRKAALHGGLSHASVPAPLASPCHAHVPSHDEAKKTTAHWCSSILRAQNSSSIMLRWAIEHAYDITSVPLSV
jgi:hypothetical protein